MRQVNRIYFRRSVGKAVAEPHGYASMAAAGHAPPYQRKSSQQNLYLPPNLPQVPPTFQAPRPCPFRPH
eukprot:jgi/Chrzof1/14063/Cz08g23080.t1